MKCPHTNTTTTETPQGPHHAKVICDDCGAFVRWLPKPETLARMDNNAKLIKALDHDNVPLSEWERGFVKSIGAQKKLSPRQQEKLEALAKKFHL